MRLSDLLRGDAAALPKAPRSGDFIEALTAAFAAYLAQVDQVDADDFASRVVRDARPAIEELGRRLITVVEASVRGQPARAQQRLVEALSLVRDSIDTLRSIPVKESALGVVYRMRKEHPGAKLARPDLFHIPFDRRHLVGPQRFSVLGVPMLYLGSTLYVCWEELRRPPLHETWVSAFRFRQPDTKVLNLAYRPGYLGDLLQTIGNPEEETPVARLCVAGAIIWPLLAACTFQVSTDGPYKIEYVIPQLLMGWLAEAEEFVGVRYFSTHVRTPAAMFASINYVFPSRDVTSSGQCAKLSSLFEMTEPVSWTYAESVGTQTSYMAHLRIKAVMELGEGHAVPYEGTEFARMEFRLDQLKFGAIC